MRVKVVMNPWSDQRRAAMHKETILTLGQHHGGLDLATTERPGHGVELARAAVEDEYDLIAAAGGDGTVHEVVNGMLRAGNTSAKLGVIPIGTGNDLAFGLGIPLRDLEAAVARLFNGRLQALDLGRVEDDRGRYEFFDNNLGIGTDAIVVMRSEAITRLRGFLLYLAAVIQTIAFYYRTLGLEIRFDEEKVSQEALLIALGIGPRHGGGFLLTPGAVQNDDLIDSCTAEPMGRLTMLRLVIQSIKGKHVTSKYVTMRKSRRITVRSDVPMPIHIDGEMFAYPRDNVRSISISSVPAAIEIMV
jgi:YegS/Rv2252/BmrU family lipid kinase